MDDREDVYVQKKKSNISYSEERYNEKCLELKATLEEFVPPWLPDYGRDLLSFHNVALSGKKQHKQMHQGIRLTFFSSSLSSCYAVYP